MSRGTLRRILLCGLAIGAAPSVASAQATLTTNGILEAASLGGPVPSLSIGDTQLLEGTGGLTPASFEVRLSAAAGSPVSVDYATQDGSATSGVDFLPAVGTLTFSPGTLSRVVTVSVVADAVVENTEVFAVALSNPQGAFILDGLAGGRILDDDVGPQDVQGSLEHGAMHTADLAADPGPAPDMDFYRITQPPYTSWEVVADAVSGDVNPIDLRLVRPDGQTTVHTAQPTGTGSSRSMRWSNGAFPAETLNELIRVFGNCLAACGSDDTYRLRVYETTLRGARFNNAGSQTTVVLLQNTGTQDARGTVRFWSPTGQALAILDLIPAMAPKEVRVISLAGIPGLAGQSGSLTVQHDAPYGVLVGKAVALEPSTGFSFDTPLEPRPR